MTTLITILIVFFSSSTDIPIYKILCQNFNLPKSHYFYSSTTILELFWDILKRHHRFVLFWHLPSLLLLIVEKLLFTIAVTFTSTFQIWNRNFYRAYISPKNWGNAGGVSPGVLAKSSVFSSLFIYLFSYSI